MDEQKINPENLDNMVPEATPVTEEVKKPEAEVEEAAEAMPEAAPETPAV